MFDFIKKLIVPALAEERPARKLSDPTFENEKFLRQIEERYSKQFEAEFGSSTVPLVDAPKPKEEIIVRKRLNSEDKYDKKDF